MTKRELIRCLESLGWRAGKDDAGESICEKALEHLTICLVPRLRSAPNEQRLDALYSVSRGDFSEAAAKIFGERPGHEPLVSTEEHCRKSLFTEKDVETLVGHILIWANKQDLEAALRKLRDLPTDCKGAMPLRHLAALAVSGDVDRLRGYKISFSQGNRLGFVPYITEEMIVRALDIAETTSAA